MSTYTPTHCPETGRKFTKAERKAANKARYAAERTLSKPKRKPKAVKVAKVTLTDEAKLLKMTKKQLVALILFHDTPDPEPTPTPKVKAKAKRKATPIIKRPKRSSAAGLEQAQARASVGVGTPKKTKVVDAETGGKAEVFKTRVEVPVQEPKARKKEMLRITLLPGEDVLTAVRRVKIQAEQAAAEASLLEAEALLNGEA